MSYRSVELIPLVMAAMCLGTSLAAGEWAVASWTAAAGVAWLAYMFK